MQIANEIVASIEYEPLTTFGLTLLLLVPAVLLWLAWQRHATVGAIFALAVLTSSALTATALGSREIYNHYFGPTHPGSEAAGLDSDAEWLWLGAVDSTEATVVAGGLPASSTVSLVRWTGSDGPVRVTATTDADGIARFHLTGLSPATEYRYAVQRGPDPHRIHSEAPSREVALSLVPAAPSVGYREPGARGRRGVPRGNAPQRRGAPDRLADLR